MFFIILLFVIGLILIIKGGDIFVDASCFVAEITGIPKMIIGATVISLATTMPEFFVSVIAVSHGSAGLGIGNAVGSIICNTGLILALCLIARPFQTEFSIFKSKSLIMFVSAILLFFFCLNRNISVFEAIILLLFFFYYLYSNIKYVKKSEGTAGRPSIASEKVSRKQIAWNICKFFLGAASIIIGARLLVHNGSLLAVALGVPESVVGVTVVALGTSLPELVTSITAIVKKETSMGVGNILGANILNITMILSTCALISPGGLSIVPEHLTQLHQILPRTLYIDIPVFLAMCAVLILPTFLTKGKLHRIQGVLLMLIYIGFIVFLVNNI